MFPQSGWLAAAFPPVFINAAIGQNAFVTAALFIGGMLLLRAPALRRRAPARLPDHQAAAWIAPAHRPSRGPAVAGHCRCGVVLARRFWPSEPPSSAPAATEAWLAQMPLYVNIGRDGLVGWHKMASVYAALRQAGVGARTRLRRTSAGRGRCRPSVVWRVLALEQRKRLQRPRSWPPPRCSQAPMSSRTTRSSLVVPSSGSRRADASMLSLASSGACRS